MWKLLKIASLSDYWENIGFDWSLIYLFYSSFLTEHQWPEAEGGWTVQIHKPHLQLRQQHFQLSAREAAALRRWEDFSFTYLKDKKKNTKTFYYFYLKINSPENVFFTWKKNFLKKDTFSLILRHEKKKIFILTFLFFTCSQVKNTEEKTIKN